MRSRSRLWSTLVIFCMAIAPFLARADTYEQRRAARQQALNDAGNGFAVTAELESAAKAITANNPGFKCSPRKVSPGAVDFIPLVCKGSADVSDGNVCRIVAVILAAEYREKQLEGGDDESFRIEFACTGSVIRGELRKMGTGLFDGRFVLQEFRNNQAVGSEYGITLKWYKVEISAAEKHYTQVAEIIRPLELAIVDLHKAIEKGNCDKELSALSSTVTRTLLSLSALSAFTGDDSIRKAATDLTAAVRELTNGEYKAMARRLRTTNPPPGSTPPAKPEPLTALDLRTNSELVAAIDSKLGASSQAYRDAMIAFARKHFPDRLPNP